MTKRIEEAQKRVAAENAFELCDNVEVEASHLENLTSQLRAVLLDIRQLAYGFQLSVGGYGSLRKCPHCSTVWTKVSGCDGETTCGQVDAGIDGRTDTFAHFAFKVDDGKLTITRDSTRKFSRQKTGTRGVGCGKKINWKEMPPLAGNQAEFTQTVEAVSVADIGMPEKFMLAAKEVWSRTYHSVGQIGRSFCRVIARHEDTR